VFISLMRTVLMCTGTKG